MTSRGVSRSRKTCLAAWDGDLVFAELGGEALDAADIELHQFVDRAHGRSVGRSGELRSNAESVDGRAGMDQIADLVFVQIAAGHDPGGRLPGIVENGANLAGEGVEIAAVEAHAPHGAAQLGGVTSAFERVVGIEQLHGSLAESGLQAAEGFHLTGERHDPGVRGGAGNGDAEAHAGEGVAGAGASAEVGRARAQNAGFRSVGAARSELNHPAALRGLDAAGGLGRDQSGKGDGGQQIRFGNLRLNDGRA